MANFEVERLEKHQPIKYAITRCYILDGATGVGVGAGLFSELLVRRGCDIFLIDVAERILATAKERVVLAGLERHLLGTHHASATDLAFLPATCCDAMLLLGPLYHLDVAAQRQQALAEASRLLHPRALLYAAGINLMTWLNAFSIKNLTASLNSETILSATFVRDVLVLHILTNRVMSTSRQSKSFERSLLLLALHCSPLSAWSPLLTTIKLPC
jgi:ubiquinone/menaquinone biosynthesis C-methylase UbiE